LADSTISFLLNLQITGIVASVELGLGITAASLATLRPLLVRIVEIVRQKSYYGRTSSNRGNSRIMNMNSAYTTDGTRVGTDTEKTNDVNFFLSATRRVSTRRTKPKVNRDSVQKSQTYTVPPIAPHEPLPDFTEPINETQPPPYKPSRFPFFQHRQPSPQPSHQIPKQEPEQSQHPLQEEEQIESHNWWGSRVRSIRNSIGSFTPAPSNFGTTHGSIMNDSEMITTDSGTTAADVERAPLETGFRRWVIERPTTSSF
jgi:hypothetical protein